MGAGSAGTFRKLIAAAIGFFFLSFAETAVASCVADEVVFRTAAGDVAFSAEVVDTEEGRAKGLMRREEMPASHGMLFVYPTAREVAFWMKDTPLPLDIIFLNKRGIVCSIAANTTPFSLEHIPSGCAAQTVFEVNAGQAAATGVSIGAVARHPAIQAPLWRCE